VLVTVAVLIITVDVIEGAVDVTVMGVTGNLVEQKDSAAGTFDRGKNKA
jgi:hypothetical protein